MKRPRVALCHPRAGFGGSEATLVWAAEALKDDYLVDIITSGTFDMEQYNELYGTSLHPDNVHVRLLSPPKMFRGLSFGDAWHGAFFLRNCRQVASDYDVLVSAYNMLDFGFSGIHLLADFSWDEEVRRMHDPVPKGLRSIFHSNALLRRQYLRIVMQISRPSGRNLFGGKDIIVANSKWTAEIMREKYGVNAQVLFPPVTCHYLTDLPEEETGFVCIGRISPEKRIEKIIEILKQVRRRGHAIHLHVIGGADESAYGRSVKRMCAAEEDWITLEGRRFGLDKARLLSRHRFGIHARPAEPFGIAVAEMVKAGCITFVPDRGGQAEIVNHPFLVYSDIDDAVEKIDSLLRDEGRQTMLSDHLARQAELFSTENFVKQIRAIVNGFSRQKLSSRSS